MKTKYEITIRHRKVLGACLIIERGTKEEAVTFVTEDTTKCGEWYTYEVMRCVKPDDEYWHRVGATYYMDGTEVTEVEYLKHIRALMKSGLKS